jgi:hypothetical protein
MSLYKRIYRFYYDGFRQMTVGKTLWLIIFIKLFIMFAIFRLFFFPDFLNSKFNSEKEKGDYVLEQLITKPQ